MKMKSVVEKSSLKLCIIGGGLTGTSMLCQFVDGLAEGLRQGKTLPKAMEICVIERNLVFGPGFPHSDQQAMPFHLINMCARDMSILSENPNDFQSWVNRHIRQIEKRFPMVRDFGRTIDEPDPDCRHYPRPIMGEYLKASFRKAFSEAEKMGIQVRCHSGHEVADIKETADDRVQITVKNLKSGKETIMAANRVLLATGHWFEEGNYHGYFASPWPADYLQSQIPEGADVAIVGTSLSAIDAVLTLTADGSFHRVASGELRYRPPNNPRHLTLYSRKALLPKVRGRNGPYRNRFLTPDAVQAISQHKGSLLLEDLFALLNRDLKAAYGRPFPWEDVVDPEGTPEARLLKSINEARYGDGSKGELVWQTVLQQVFPMVRQLYLALSPAERMWFDQEFSTQFFIYAAPMPMINAEKLLALMQSGVVSVRKAAGRTPFKVNGESYSFAFTGPGGEEMDAKTPWVVDARGQGRFYNRNPQVLAVNLLESGTVEIEPLLGEAADGKDGLRTEHRAKTASTEDGTGSLWVDPETHRVRRTGVDGRFITSNCIYAVGAMTRGQIIDASMARGSAVSTQVIAQDWVKQVFSQDSQQGNGCR